VTTGDRRDESNLRLARQVLEIEGNAVHALRSRVDHKFLKAVELLETCRGRVITTGIGKSGIIAKKIAATFSSTGTAAYFVHPSEGVHGDVGVIQSEDVVVGLSHSGETPELLRLLERIRRLGSTLIALTGVPNSSLAETADITLDCSVESEACPLNLAPTASTTATLALGDALAMVLLTRKGFKEEDFANLHPGGELGKRLLRVERLMHVGNDIPSIGTDASVDNIISAMTDGGFGLTCVLKQDGTLAGLITDGDLRRHLQDGHDFTNTTATQLMTSEPQTVSADTLAVEALNLMENHRITSLLVTDSDKKLCGLVHLHDLWGTELF
jgi:arabinose-5-phosphate isomerase